jgi:hypothetical protein
MMRDRDRTALLFLPRSVWHRFREPESDFTCRCRAQALHSDLAASSRSSTAKHTRSSRWTNACTTLRARGLDGAPVTHNC